MCRMILAIGEIDASKVFRAAWQMATGQTADHERPVPCHPDGWGAVYRDPSAPDGLRAIRSGEPMPETTPTEVPPGTDLLAVHVRHATVTKTRGEQFAHPITRWRPTPWYLLHNGYLPSVHRNLDLNSSQFDSGELFEYLVPPTGTRLDRHVLLTRLNNLDPTGTSANSIFINSERAYVLQWSFPIAHRRYFTMFCHRGANVTYFSSERVPTLAPVHAWKPLYQGDLIECPFPISQESLL